MAVVAVCKNGREVIGDHLVRGHYEGRGSIMTIGLAWNTRTYRTELDEEWFCLYFNPDEGPEDIAIELPQGSIEKLLGRKLTWEDEPVELV